LLFRASADPSCFQLVLGLMLSAARRYTHVDTGPSTQERTAAEAQEKTICERK